jgi:hypothetical protein
MRFWKVLRSRLGFEDQKHTLHRFTQFELEELETRYLLSTFTVTTVADSGAGSLRQAIVEANLTSDPDTIQFAIGSGQQTIKPLSPLPNINHPLTIDGTTQPDFEGQPLIELDGSMAGANSNGLRISAGNSTVRGLVINRFAKQGILINARGNNLVVGNYIGTDFSGTLDLGNKEAGVAISSSPGNIIGGSVASAANLISGNDRHGVRIIGTSKSNLVVGNFIGTNKQGTAALGNRVGVTITAGENRVGGLAAGERNVISGNTRVGVYIAKSSAIENAVLSNLIGTDFKGTSPVGNTGLGGMLIAGGASSNQIGLRTDLGGNVISGNAGAGVTIRDGSSRLNRFRGNMIGTNKTGSDLGNTGDGIVIDGANSNRIGNGDTIFANVISGNDLSGVYIKANAQGNWVQGNQIGSAGLGNSLSGVLIDDAALNQIGRIGADPNVITGNQKNGVTVIGDASTGNMIVGNSIFANVLLGIDLGNDGVTGNDDGLDGDIGPNNLQNFPVLVSANKNGSDLEIVYFVDTTATFPLRVEFFLADGIGQEGKKFVGFDSYSALDAAAGNKSITLAMTTVLSGQRLLATATDADDNTSEFSASVQVTGDTPGFNDPPSIAVNNPAIVDEAQTVIITTLNLEEGDPDDDGVELTYELQSPLLHGTLRVNGVVASEFTQANIDANQVTYTHDGGESTSDFFDFTLRDGGEDGAGPAFDTFNITINPINDPPTIVANNVLPVSPQGTATITTVYLNGIDPDDSGTGLTYSVTTPPTAGQLELSTNPGVAITSFTQADLENNRVRYVHSMGTPDSFEFSLADGGEDGAAAATGTFNIDIGDNDQPIIDTNTGATVNEGGLVTIDNTKLKATDPDDFGVGLVFTLTAGPSKGELRLNGFALLAGDPLRDKFTQADIDNGRVKYLHYGDEDTADSFDFSLADGGEDMKMAVPGTFSITINPVDDPPTLATNTGLTVAPLGTVTINNTELNEGDPDDDGADVYYFFRSGVGAVPVNGTLFFDADGAGGNPPVALVADTNNLLGEPGGAPDFFTQADLDAGLVTYVNSGGTSDSFTFILGTDPSGINFLQVFGETATVNIVIDNPGNDAPVLANIESSQLQYIKGGSPIKITNAITIADVDDTNMDSAVVRISSYFKPGDQLLFTDALGVTGLYNPGTGVLTLTGSASKLAYQGLLRTIEFVNNSPGVIAAVRTIEFVVNDGDDNSNAQTRNINVVISTPPFLDLDADDSTTSPESIDAIVEFFGDGEINLTSGVSISDVDDTNMESASIVLTNPLDGTDESLGINTGLATSLGIGYSFGANNQSIFLTGTATNAQYAQLLDTVTYNNVNPEHNTATRVIEFVVNDGNENSQIARSFIASIAPTLMLGDGSTNTLVTFDTDVNEALLVPDGSTISDPDDTQMESAKITLIEPFGVNDGISPPQEFLTIDESLAASLGISFNYDPLNPILITLSGSASRADYQAVLDTAKYHYSNSFFIDNRTIEFVVNDGERDSNVATSTVLAPGNIQ